MQVYSWSLRDVIDTTIWAFYRIHNQWIDNTSPEDILHMLHMNTRIIRWILDYKGSKNARNFDFYELIQELIKISLWVYNLDEKVMKGLFMFSQKIEDILDFWISQTKDPETWKAMNPEYSQVTANTISRYLWTDDYIFIAFWHWWILSWIDVFQRVSVITTWRWELYPIRFSIWKMKDFTPRLNDYEVNLFRSLSKWKKIILYDEDSCSGRTLKRWEKYFFKNIKKDWEILKISNIWRFWSK